MAEDEPVFRTREEDVDWQLVLDLKERDFVEQLIKADRDQQQEALEKLVGEIEEKTGNISSWRVNAEDGRADVENLAYLFQLTQALMEIKNGKFIDEETEHKASKDKLKKAREENKESRQRIKEQDAEIEELQSEMTSVLGASRTKGEGTADPKKVGRLEAELNTAKKEVESTKEELNTQRRLLEQERLKSGELQSKMDTAQESNIKVSQELEDLQRQFEDLQRRTAEEEKKQQKVRAQAQKTTKEAYKFVREITELSRRNEELEQENKAFKEEIDLVTNDSLAVRDELTEIRTLLENTERVKEELEQDNAGLRQQVNDMRMQEDERENEQESFIADITKKVRVLKEENAQRGAELEKKDRELREANATIKRMEQEKKQSEVERRMSELETRITQLEEEKAEVLEQYIQIQRENHKLKDESIKIGEDQKKERKRLQAHYRAKENEVRTSFYERQEEMAEAERRNTEMDKRIADLQDDTMELEQHITELQNGTFGLTQAMNRIKEQKKELETVNNRVSSRTKELNEALRKIEDLHEEVRMLRDHTSKIDPSLRATTSAIGFVEIGEGDKEILEWNGLKDGFKLDISAYKVRTAMELEKAKAVTLQLEREVEALEVERLEMKSQLRHLSMQRGERAAKLGLSAYDVEKLDAFAEQLKRGDTGPAADAGPSAGENIKLRKLQERMEKQEKELKDKSKELTEATETIAKLKEDAKNSRDLQTSIAELQRLHDGLISGYQEQLIRQQQSSGDGGGGRRRSIARDGSETSAAPVLPMTPMGLGAGQLGELLKNLKGSDIGEQASVDVTIIGAKNLPSANTYAVVTVHPHKASKTSNKILGNQSPQFNELIQLAVPERNSDVVRISFYEAPARDEPDPGKDHFIGKAETPVQTFGRDSKDGSWTGALEGSLPLLDETNNPVMMSSNSRNQAMVAVKLTFQEAPRKKISILEEQLQSRNSLIKVNNERIEARDKEIENLKDDLERKREDLEHVITDRNKIREELQRARMNSAAAPSATPVPIVISHPGDAEGDGKKGIELTEAYTKLSQELGDVNAYLIQTLDDLSKRDEELATANEEIKSYKEYLDVLRVQQVLLYKEHTSKLTDLEKDLGKATKQWTEEKRKSEVEAVKASSALEKLKSLAREDTNQDGTKKALIEAERKVILLQADQDIAERVKDIKKEEAEEIRTRYDGLVVDMAKQEHRLKQRIGALDRSRQASEKRLVDCQRQLASSVSKEELNKLREEYLQLKEKHSAQMSKESKTMLEVASAEQYRQKSEQLTQQQEELKLQLKEATDRANALTSRLEHLAMKDGPPEQQLLSALSEKLVKLEVSERNAVRRSELSLERMRSLEKDSNRLQERITRLEDETVESAARIRELEETDRELRSRLDGSISAEQADELRKKVSEQESEITELKINSNKFQEVADLATDQAKAMEELQTVHMEELQALRAYISQMQAESDDQAEKGMLQRRVMDRERQLSELTSRVATLDRELVRMDEYVVRLEDTLERKSEQLHKQSEESDGQVKRLEQLVEDLRSKAAGQIPLEKADQWAASLRDLTEQKRIASEELSNARKQKQEAEHKAETLQIELEDQKNLVKQLKADKAHDDAVPTAQSDKMVASFEELTRIKLENLRLTRQVKQLQEREAHLEQCNQLSEKDVRKLEEQLVAAEQLKHEAQEQPELKMQNEKLKARIIELESAPRVDSAVPRSNTLGAFTSAKAAEITKTVQELTSAESHASDKEVMRTLRDEVLKLTDALQKKEDEIDSLHQELDSLSMGRKDAGAEGGGIGGSGANEAAQHTQEVARLTIERLEKNNKRKNEMIKRYQEQLQLNRDHYMAQKDEDNATIEQLREELAQKTTEAIQNMRNRSQTQTSVPVLTGTAADDADAVFAEKDQVISALNAELQSVKRKVEDLQQQKEKMEAVVQSKTEEVDKLSTSLTEAQSKKPSQVLETLVFKLKKQLADKEKKQADMKAAIESLREEMFKATEGEAARQAAAIQSATGGEGDAAVAGAAKALEQNIQSLEGKLSKVRSDLQKVKKELEDERGRTELLSKEKENMEGTIRRQGLDLKKAQRISREREDSVKQLEAAADSDNKRLKELEQKVREMERKADTPAGRPVSRRGEDPEGRDRGDSREEAHARWDAEKRLEAKVERLTNKLREHRKELEAMDKQNAHEKDKSSKEATKLRQRIDQLEEDKKQLKAKIRGGGPSMDSDEVLTRVREAERKVLELQEENEKIRKAHDVDERAKQNSLMVKQERLETSIKQVREERDAKEQQLLAAEDETGFSKEKSKEIRRLEGELTEVKNKVEELEGDLLSKQNEIIRLRFETDHAELRLQRWQRRVRELEALPLAVGKADDSEPKGSKRKTKEEEEMERFVRSTKVAMEKLHKENESLRANTASNIKYMDAVREVKTLKGALADRDREILTLNDKLVTLREQADKKQQVDEKSRLLKNKLEQEKEEVVKLRTELATKDRDLKNLTAELQTARELVGSGGEGAVSGRVQQYVEEIEQLQSDKKKMLRDKDDLEKEAQNLRREVREANTRADEYQAKLEDQIKRMPGSDLGDRGTSSAEVNRLKKELKKLQDENEDLRGELNSFDPSFFDEIEDLKYNHDEMVKLVDRYENLLEKLSEKYGFEFSRQAARPRRTT